MGVVALSLRGGLIFRPRIIDNSSALIYLMTWCRRYNQ